MDIIEERKSGVSNRKYIQKQESTESENSEGQVENIGKDIEQLEPIG
jgi:choline kinase